MAAGKFSGEDVELDEHMSLVGWSCDGWLIEWISI